VPPGSQSHQQLAALFKITGGDEAKALMATLQAELEEFQAALDAATLVDAKGARRLFHKILGFANQFYFNGLSKAAQTALDQTLDDYRQSGAAIVDALEQARATLDAARRDFAKDGQA
jgi:hypothetical protein